MPQNNTKHQFQEHLDKIREAKQLTQNAFHDIDPAHHIAQTNLHLAWDCLFDHFCTHQPASDLANLNTLSAVIHKLTGAYTQIKNLEIKSRELLIKEKEHQSKLEKTKAANLPLSKKTEGLTPETLVNIEEQLGFL